MRFWTTVLVVVACLAAGGTAEANKAKAKEAYKRGMAAYTLEKYDDAIAQFEKGYEEEPNAVFLYNIAQAYRLSNRPIKAIQFYKKYLKLAPDAANRPEVEKHIAILEEATGSPTEPMAPGQIPGTSTPQPTSILPSGDVTSTPSTSRTTRPETSTTAATRPDKPPATTAATPSTSTATTPRTTATQPELPDTDTTSTTTPPTTTTSVPPDAMPPRSSDPAKSPTDTPPATKKRTWPIWVGVAAGVVVAGAAVGVAVAATRSSETILPLQSAQ